MDDQVNQSSIPASPVQGSDMGAQAPVFQTPSSGAANVSGEIAGMPSPTGGSMRGSEENEDPHGKILASLARIEEKLASIAVKVGV